MRGLRLTQIWCHDALRVPMLPQARHPASLGFVGIDWESLVIASTGVRDKVCATAQTAIVVRIDDVDHQWRMNIDGGVERRGTLRPLQVTIKRLSVMFCVRGVDRAECLPHESCHSAGSGIHGTARTNPD